jgi:anti-anti-sigma regulatory factor
MNTFTISFDTIGLASRFTAIEKRELVLSEVNKGNKVIIDLTNVKFLSGSFADELFGVLFEDYGKDWLRENVTVKFKDPFIQKIIAETIDYRDNQKKDMVVA